MSDKQAIRQSVRDHIEKRLGSLYSPLRKLCAACDGDGTVAEDRMVVVCKKCKGSGLAEVKS